MKREDEATAADVETRPEVLYLVRAWTETSSIIYVARRNLCVSSGIKGYRIEPTSNNLGS